MRIPALFLDVGGGLFMVLGLLHALYTFRDIARPRRLVPDDPAVTAAMQHSHLRLTQGRTTMWQAWVGFNFSHSVGVVLLGALCVTAGVLAAAGTAPRLGLLALFGIGLVYVVIAARYWFRIPIAGAAIATACLLLAWLTYSVPPAH
jgi:hypothetical protein